LHFFMSPCDPGHTECFPKELVSRRGGRGGSIHDRRSHFYSLRRDCDWLSSVVRTREELLAGL